MKIESGLRAVSLRQIDKALRDMAPSLTDPRGKARLHPYIEFEPAIQQITKTLFLTGLVFEIHKEYADKWESVQLSMKQALEDIQEIIRLLQQNGIKQTVRDAAAPLIDGLQNNIQMYRNHIYQGLSHVLDRFVVPVRSYSGDTNIINPLHQNKRSEERKQQQAKFHLEFIGKLGKQIKQILETPDKKLRDTEFRNLFVITDNADQRASKSSASGPGDIYSNVSISKNVLTQHMADMHGQISKNWGRPNLRDKAATNAQIDMRKNVEDMVRLDDIPQYQGTAANLEQARQHQDFMRKNIKENMDQTSLNLQGFVYPSKRPAVVRQIREIEDQIDTGGIYLDPDMVAETRYLKEAIRKGQIELGAVLAGSDPFKIQLDPYQVNYMLQAKQETIKRVDDTARVIFRVAMMPLLRVWDEMKALELQIKTIRNIIAGQVQDGPQQINQARSQIRPESGMMIQSKDVPKQKFTDRYQGAQLPREMGFQSGTRDFRYILV